MFRRGPILICSLAVLAAGLHARAAEADLPALAAERRVEPVVLTGAQFPGWSAGPEVSTREPVATSGEPGAPFNSDCPDDAQDLNHNCSNSSRIDDPREGVAVGRLIGYRWNAAAGRFAQIPFQADERFTRYISNLASNCGTQAGPFCVGFGQYSGADPQLSYVFDRDRYRYTLGTCTAEPEAGPEQDPVPGLDDNDELAFLYRDTGPAAPSGASLPRGVAEMRQIRIEDPSSPASPARYAYVALATSAKPAFTSTNGYVRYTPDPDADVYEETSDNYGNAPRGPVCDSDGNVVKQSVPRRPRDTAWVFTPRFAFRYAGRWTLRGVRVNPDPRATTPLAGESDYGPPLLDQWKARAYQQRPGDSTPCCGFETEQDNWNDTSVTLGERAGPVRVIRATWGSDSGTNTVREEIFYPDVIVQHTYLRVHPIPPLGGIFSYWDHTAGVVTRYYNPQRPEGVVVDGRNDEVVGNTYVALHNGGVEVNSEDDTPVVGRQSIGLGSQSGCVEWCTSFDVTDPTLNATGVLSWEQVSGPYGSMIFRSGINQVTPGAAQGFAAIPYYRDDSCFDDGTGTDPGPHLKPKAVDTPERPCWKPEDGRPSGDPSQDVRWRQGLIGAHGVQVLFAAETDNAMLTAPLDELDAETRMVVLPGDPGNVGARYGMSSDVPLRTIASPVAEGFSAPKQQTSITFLEASASQGRIGDTALFAARLDDEDGPVAGAALSFDVQGSSYAATTDSGGVASVQVPVHQPAGPTTIAARFAGDAGREPSEGSAAFTVLKRDSRIAFSAERGLANVVVAIVLTDAARQSGLPARPVEVFVNGTKKATVQTNDAGRASATFTLAPAPGATVRVAYNGDDTYLASSAQGVWSRNGAAGSS